MHGERGGKESEREREMGRERERLRGGRRKRTTGLTGVDACGGKTTMAKATDQVSHAFMQCPGPDMVSVR